LGQFAELEPKDRSARFTFTIPTKICWNCPLSSAERNRHLQHDKHYVELVEKLFQSVRDQTQSAVKGGLSLEATIAKVDLQRFRKQLAGDDNLRNQTFDMGFVKPGVERAWREAKEGSLSDEN